MQWADNGELALRFWLWRDLGMNNLNSSEWIPSWACWPKSLFRPFMIASLNLLAKDGKKTLFYYIELNETHQQQIIILLAASQWKCWTPGLVQVAVSSHTSQLSTFLHSCGTCWTKTDLHDLSERNTVFSLGLEQIGASTLLGICSQSAARAFWVELFCIGAAQSWWRVFLDFQKGPGSEKNGLVPMINEASMWKQEAGVGSQSSMKELLEPNGCDVTNDWPRAVLAHGTAWN